MRKGLIVLSVVGLLVPKIFYAQGPGVRSLQERYARKAQTQQIMGEVIWIGDSLLPLFKAANPEALSSLETDSLWIFRLLLNTHSPSVNFTQYDFGEKPYLQINPGDRLKIWKWIQGPSMMPSHHMNGFLLFKKRAGNAKNIRLVLPELFGDSLVFSWDRTP